VGHLNVIKLPPALRTLLAQEAFGFLRQQQALTDARPRTFARRQIGTDSLFKPRKTSDAA
jgi:hypothetical protein